ncbi:MAG TPA: KEOPS complex subunit Cgi121 [archaeon]|nr:KEOPS complex subunit Cgi121 [archaeon]
MICAKIGDQFFAISCGKINNDSYSATIKKLTVAQRGNFVQIVPQRFCAGKNHFLIALEHATSALQSNQAITKNLLLEFLVHFFGKRQLDQVFEDAKFEQGEDLIAITDAKEKEHKKILQNLGFEENKSEKMNLQGQKKELMQFYGIGKEELGTLSDKKNALEELVIEKISFVALQN